MKKAMLLVVLLCLLAGLGATAGVFSLGSTSTSGGGARVSALASSPASTSLVDQGKAALQAHNILSARDLFSQAVTADPTNQEANLLYGVTRVFAILENQYLGSAGLQSVRQIFELSGFSFQTFGLYGAEGTDPGAFVQGMPRSGAVLDFVKTNVLPEIDGALINLAAVTDPAFSSSIAPADINKYSGQNISVDYADALVIKALLNAVKCNLNLLMVYGLDVNIPDIAAAPKQLLTYKSLFADANFLSVKDPASLTTAKNALISFIATYKLALPQLTARSGTSPNAAHHLFVVDVPVSTNEPFELSVSGLNDINSVLDQINASLGGTAVSFSGSGPLQDPVNLAKFFNAPLNLRYFLGDCSTGTRLPDATLGGLFPNQLSSYAKLVAENGADLLGVVCSGSTYSVPKMVVDPGYLWINDYSGYSSGPQSVTINNYGTGTLHASSIALGGINASAFTLAPGSCSSLAPVILAGSSCTVIVDLKRPIVANGYQSQYATLQIASDDQVSPLSSTQISGYVYPSSGGSISGVVTLAKTGAGISGASVSLYDSTTNTPIKSTSTNNTGGYTFSSLNAGSYKLYYYAGPSYQAKWYNGKLSQATGDAVVLTANANLTGINTVLSPAPVTLSWGTVWHRTQADGTQYDALDVGINSSATTLSPMTVRVDGPGGFTPYTFTENDKIPYLNGRFTLFKSYSSGKLPSGVYTVSMSDANGNASYRLSSRAAAPKALPVVDSKTIQWQRKADGSYRFSWAPVNDSQTYYYRVRIALNDASSHNGYNTPVVMSERSPITYIDVPQVAGSVNPLSDGTPYLVRVEVMDAPTVDLVTSRTDSAFVNFTPQSSDYNPERLLVTYVSLENRTESDGALSTEVDLSVNNPSAVSSVDLRDSSGTVIYSFLPGDRSNLEFWKKFSTPLASGSYTLHFVANGVDHYSYLTLTTPVSYPIPGTTGMQVEDQGNGYLRFSWANVDHAGPLYYRVMVYDTITGPLVNGGIYYSTRQNVNFVDIPKSALGDLSTKQWRVEVCDSGFVTTMRNRVNGPLIALTPVAFDPARPVIGSWRVRSLTSPAGVTRSQVLVSASASQAPLASIMVSGPGGYSRNLLASPARYSTLYGSYALEEAGAPAAGLYTITALDAAGRSSQRYIYQSAVHPVAPVDFHTFHTNLEANGDTRVSWAPVLSDLPLWYQLSLYSATDQNGDGLMDAPAFTPSASVDVNYDGTADAVTIYPLASVTIPAATVLPAAPMFRISTLDGGTSFVLQGGTQAITSNTVHNLSQSAMVKAEAAGFNYGGLSDTDGDGFASDVDSDDNNAAVYPFAGGNDTLPLTVTQSSPANGSTGVAAASSICATFDKALDARTLTGNFTVSGGVTGSLSYQLAGTSSVCLIPSAPLPANTQLTATLSSAVADQAGNHLAPYSWSFSTAATPASVASPAAGSYPSAQTVTLTSNAAGAAIYYTTDGTTPTYPASVSTMLYSAPITVTGNSTLQYFARNASGSETPHSSAYSITTPGAPGWIQAVPGAGQVTVSWSPTTGAQSYNVYLTGVSAPAPATGTAFHDAIASGWYWLDSNGNDGAGTNFYESGLDVLNPDGATISESSSNWDSVSQVWSALTPVSTHSRTKLGPTGWVVVNSDLPGSIAFNPDGSATVTGLGDLVQQRLTLGIVELAGVPIGASGVSSSIPFVPGALVFPAGARRYDMTQTQLTDSYQVNGSAVPPYITTLEAIPGAYLTTSVNSQNGGTFQYQVSFTGGNQVSIVQYNYSTGTSISIGTGTWDIRTVSGQQILAVTIPPALRTSYGLGPDPFYAIVNGVITGGDHTLAGSVKVDTSFNKAAMDHLKTNLSPVLNSSLNLPVGATSSSSFVHAGLSANTTYSYQVRPSNSLGEGARSAVVSATVLSAGSADTTAPAIATFSVPATSNSLKVAITSLTATDNQAVSAFLVSESASAPAAGAAGWSTTTPTSYTFSGVGSKTLYAWAKDLAGNVSTSRSAAVAVSTTPPTVNSFSVPLTSTSLTVPITVSGSGGVAIAGYFVSESSATPALTAAGWSPTAPTSYTFPSGGTHTLYAFVKDASGLISAPMSGASVTISWILTVQNSRLGGGIGTDVITSTPAGILCYSGSGAGCSAQFNNAAQVLLTPNASSYSTFTGWSGAGAVGCSGTGTCLVAMNAAQSITASFSANPATVRIDGSTALYYAMGSTFDLIAATGQRVLARSGVFVENIILNSQVPEDIKFKGGFTDNAFSVTNPTSRTVIDGYLKIRKGSLRVDGLAVR